MEDSEIVSDLMRGESTEPRHAGVFESPGAEAIRMSAERHKRDFIERAAIAAVQGFIANKRYDADSYIDSAEMAVAQATALWDELQKESDHGK